MGFVVNNATLGLYIVREKSVLPSHCYDNDMIYLLTAIGLSPGGSSTHLHTNNT